MKRLKMKLLSLMLIIAMLSSMLGITTFAQHGSEATDNGSVTLDTVIDLLCDKYQGTSDLGRL